MSVLVVTATSRPWWQTSLIVAGVAMAFVGLTLFLPLGRATIILVAGAVVFVWTLWHNPAFWLRRLASVCVSSAILLGGAPVFSAALNLGSLGAILVEHKDTTWLVLGLLVIAVVAALLEVLRERASALSPEAPTMATSSSTAGIHPQAQGDVSLQAQGDIVGGNKNITVNGGQMFMGPVTFAAAAAPPPRASLDLVLAMNLKLLYERAAGRCSMPDCRIPLSADGTSGLTIFGEVRRIVEDPPGGRSADPKWSSLNKDAYENLILLCPTHSRLIDAQTTVYSAVRLNAIKREHESWVTTTLTQTEENAVDLVISYLVIRGDEGLPELKKGSASAIFGKTGSNFQIVAGPILSWALRVRQWYNQSIGDYETYAPINWEKLNTMGAPLAGLRHARTLIEEFRRRNIPDKVYLEYGDSWCQVGGYTCSGQDAAHGLVSTMNPPLAPGLQTRRIAELRAWIQKTFKTRKDDSGETTALMPCVLIREPLLYCLNIEANGFTGGSLTLKYEAKVLDVIPLQGRPILYPIGCAFEPAEAGEVLIRATDTVFQPDESETPPDVEVATRSMYSEQGYLRSHMVGETRLVDEYEIRDARNALIGSGKVRVPYRVKEYLKCYMYGACCPEVLFRKSRNSWERFGPVLVGAAGESRARSETVYLADLAPGEDIDVCVFEIPGEQATLTVQLILSSALYGDTVSDQRCQFRLEPGERILLSGRTDHAVKVYLRAEGYFVKIHENRLVNLQFTSANDGSRSAGTSQAP